MSWRVGGLWRPESESCGPYTITWSVLVWMAGWQDGGLQAGWMAGRLNAWMDATRSTYQLYGGCSWKPNMEINRISVCDFVQPFCSVE